jgi:hypothetical protein
MTPRSTKLFEAVRGGRRSPVGDGLGRGAVDHVINSALAPTILLFSDDVSLFHLTARAAGKEWKLERCDDLRNCREWLVRPEVGLVIVDDEAIEEHLRGWLLERVRTYAPRAPFLYVAGRHSNEGEKRARAYAAGYYTSKPVEAGSLERVLASFISLAQPLNQKPRNWSSKLGAKRK